jgi:hypothetical protein
MNKKQILEEDAAKTYNQFKVFEGKKYTGMKVGGRHKWYYDKGEWKEKKVAPDRWEFSYAVHKRRAGHAPAGSGVPVGTEYHWYILAHQNVRKLDANTYTTSLSGLKYKLAHKRAGKETWSASDQAQRRQLIKILQEMIDNLSSEKPAEQEADSKQRKRSNGRHAARETAPTPRRLVAAGGRSRR